MPPLSKTQALDPPTRLRRPASERPILIGHEIYRASSYGPYHPLRVPRVSTVLDLTHALGWVAPGQFLRAPRIKPEALHVWHTPEYVAALYRAEQEGAVSDAVRARHNIGTHANPVFPEVWRRPATSAGGSMLAGMLLEEGGIVHHPAGGTHHAMPDAAGGFCYLNDPVLSILSLRAHGAQRIAYVDIDAHHCDGVEAGLAQDRECLLVSVHEENRWPRTGPLGKVGSAVNLPVPRGLNDTEFAMILEELIVPLVAQFQPDAVVLQCGADAVLEDPLSRLALSNRAHFSAVAALRPLSPRYLVLGGGGYNPWTVGRLWTGVWGVLNNHDMPDRLPVQAREVLAALEWHGVPRARRTPAPELIDTLQDAPREGPIRERVRADVAHLRQITGLQAEGGAT